MIDLSILICSTHTRYKTFGRAIQDQVWSQYRALPPKYQDRIEILMFTDNKKAMLGQKRNIMVDAAQGRYVQFVDDDDRIEPDMFRTVLDAIDSDADVITFLVSVSLNGKSPKICRYSKDYKRDRNTADEYFRLPNHICAVKRELAQSVSFPNLPKGEDSAYSKLLRPKLRTEFAIDRVLYHYDWCQETTETQPQLNGVKRQRSTQEPVVDVVIMSNASTSGIRRMTQRTIDSCIAGANSLSVNVIVMEQQKNCIYNDAETFYRPGEFNYNKFANEGAARGEAEWIMIANNDLVFRDCWLHHLLVVDYPVVSPKCPRDSRQTALTENVTGYWTARHFSGWCFMLKRELWKTIGGFDDCVSFWCSDDVVIEQVKAAGIAPMLVVDSYVEHLKSVTLNTQPNKDDLTWKQIDIFNRKYGRHRLSDNPRFIAWQHKQNA